MIATMSALVSFATTPFMRAALSPFRALTTDGCSYNDTGPETGTETRTDEVKFRAVVARPGGAEVCCMGGDTSLFWPALIFRESFGPRLRSLHLTGKRNAAPSGR